VSGGHAHGLLWHEESRLHDLAPQCKLVAAGLFIVAVVLTPPQQLWAFALYVLLLGVAIDLSRVAVAFILRRMSFGIPFLLFAITLPFLGDAPHTEILGVGVSSEGAWDALNLVMKGGFGIATCVLLTATTSMADLLKGFARLRAPRTMIAIAGFMIRFGDLTTGEMRRMRTARLSRGYDPAWWWETRALAASIGTLFIRSFERGERVYLAMVSRGYSGEMPEQASIEAAPRDWLRVSIVVLPAAVICLIALGVHP
jgi:cobalt/nickel transport system permease protein